MHRASFIVLAVGLTACGPHSQPVADAGTPDIFIAFAADFSTFRGWPWFHRDALDDGGVDALTSGPFTEYLSKRPAHGATEFAVGTMIVKVIEETNPPIILAMAKRGGGFNPDGAQGWEWFQLTENATTVDILWRGKGPPANGVYGGDPRGCNRCHLTTLGNDSVKSPVLQLDGF